MEQSKRSKSGWLVILLLNLLVLSACSSDNDNSAEEEPVEDDIGNDPVTFAEVQSIFSARCTLCHAGASPPLGLDLSASNAYQNTVGVASSQQPGLSLIEPSNSDASYLVRKIRGDAGISGARMPGNGPPYLSDDDINTIVAWVDAGAQELATWGGIERQYIAELIDFQNYADWHLVQEIVAAPSICDNNTMAASSMQVKRRVFANNKAWQIQDRKFEPGSIIVKEVTEYVSGTTQNGQTALLAMVKRGGGFNTAFSGWEWFKLGPKASAISGRGAYLADDTCNSCHSQAEALEAGSIDYVFDFGQ